MKSLRTKTTTFFEEEIATFCMENLESTQH